MGMSRPVVLSGPECEENDKQRMFPKEGSHVIIGTEGVTLVTAMYDYTSLMFSEQV